MDELNKIVKDVPATSFFDPKPPTAKSLDETIQDLILTLNLNVDDTIKLKSGISMERLKTTPLLKILLETIVTIIDNNQKMFVGDKNDDSLYLQNKKVVREIAFSLFQLLNHYNYDEKQMKTLLLGKLIQSMYGSRY